MGIDLTPNPDNRNLVIGGAPMGGTVTPEIKDHIQYDAEEGKIFYTYDSTTGTFVLLNLPRFMRNAPERVKCDTVQWIKGIITSRHAGIEEPDKPQSLIDYLEDPKTKAIRAQMKRGYISLEDYA